MWYVHALTTTETYNIINNNKNFVSILIIIFDFPGVFYVRIYYFRKYFNWETFYYGPIHLQYFLLEVTLTSNFAAELEYFVVVASFAYHIRLPQRFLC
jgi:hypothetical protein